MIEFAYAGYVWEQAAAVLAIDSPAGFTGKAAVWVMDACPLTTLSDVV